MLDNFASREQYRDRFGEQNPGSYRERGDEYAGQWDRRNVRVEQGMQEHTFPPNRRMPVGSSDGSGMDELQRLVSGVSGAAILWFGWQQSGLKRWPLTALGAGLLYQGIAGDNLLDRLPFAQEIPIVREMTSEPTNLRIRKTLTINKPAEELYAYWRNLGNLPNFMSHIKAVQEVGDDLSHWVVQVINDMELEWDARITVDRPNEMIAWETLPEADIANRGYVKFIPTARGTEVSASIEYDPPTAAGRLAGRAVKFIAEQQVKEDIRNFKRLMETGEIPTTKGQPAARKEAWKQSHISIAQNPAGVGVQSNSSDTSTMEASGRTGKSATSDSVGTQDKMREGASS